MLRNKFLLLLAAIALVGAALWLQIPPSTPTVAGAGDAAPVASVPEQHPHQTPRQNSNKDQDQDPATRPQRDAYPDFLPVQAHVVLQRIASGSPHPYRQDGSTFQNREGRLPRQPRGYYREYTVDTPGLDHRGARRIITGGQPPAVYYYTDDHYGSFRNFELPQEWQAHE